MGVLRTIGAVVATTGSRTPIYTGPVIAAVSFVILKGIATISLGAGNLPANGYNGPDGQPIPYVAGGYNSNVGKQGKFPAAGGQQVTLWGFTTATYFNGLTVSVIDCNPTLGTFSFYFNHANVASTADTGNTAAAPSEHYRSVRLECSQTNGADFVYVGDLNVSSTRYMAALSLTGEIAIEIDSQNIPADRIFIDATASTDSVQVTLLY